jgi:hypothetical protein
MYITTHFTSSSSSQFLVGSALLILFLVFFVVLHVLFLFCFFFEGGGGILEFVLAPKGFYIIWLSKYFDLRYMTQNKDEQNQKTQQRKLETKLAARSQPETGMKRN